MKIPLLWRCELRCSGLKYSIRLYVDSLGGKIISAMSDNSFSTTYEATVPCTIVRRKHITGLSTVVVDLRSC